jgi:hypothetical protein
VYLHEISPVIVVIRFKSTAADVGVAVRFRASPPARLTDGRKGAGRLLKTDDRAESFPHEGRDVTDRRMYATHSPLPTPHSPPLAVRLLAYIQRDGDDGM